MPEHDFSLPGPITGLRLCSRCGAQSMYKGPCEPRTPDEVKADVKRQFEWVADEVARKVGEGG